MAPREMRPSIREDDPRAAAKRRAAEILGTGADFDADGVDDFAVPAPPDGWSYEWKRFSSMNMEDRSHQNHVKSTGWQPVPATRHPEMMEAGATGAIERKGMMLMERPEEITNMVKERDYRKARNEVTHKEQQLKASEPLFAGRADSRVRAKVGKSYEPLIIPEE